MATTSSTSSAAQQIYDTLNAKTAASTSKSKVDAQQDRFLKLLTTQLKNQDPLNPMDNAQTTSQLAQISTVDGIEKLNTTLATLMTNMKSNDTLQAATLVGHAVLVAGGGIQVASGMGVGGVALDDPASRVTVTVTDSSGKTLRTLELGKLDAGTHEFVWDGKDNAGNAVADGSYKMTVSATNGDKKVGASTLQLATVNSVVSDGGTTKLDLGKLGRVSLGDIKLIL